MINIFSQIFIQNIFILPIMCLIICGLYFVLFKNNDAVGGLLLSLTGLITMTLENDIAIYFDIVCFILLIENCIKITKNDLLNEIQQKAILYSFRIPEAKQRIGFVEAGIDFIKIPTKLKLNQIILKTISEENEFKEDSKKEYINNIEKILLKIKKQPDIYLTIDNHIQFEYLKKTGAYLTLEFSDSNKILVYCSYDYKTEKRFSINNDLNEINKTIHDFRALRK